MIRISKLWFVFFMLCFSIGYSQKDKINKESFKTLYNEQESLLKKQSDELDEKSKWTKRGEINVAFNQSSFSNWKQGGANSLTVNTSIKYFLTYETKEHIWDSRLRLEYGFTSLQSDDFSKKTQDLIEANSLYGIRLSEYFFASAFTNFYTQFTTGYEYSKKDGKSIRTANTSFMSPGILKIGIGALWKSSENLKVNISPLTANLIFVNKEYTLPKAAYYGVDEGKSFRNELGANIEAYLKLKLVENVTAEQILNLYANYLQNFGNIDIFYRLSVLMSINKFLSANFNFDAIYDDNAFPGLQTRQVLGVGINYNF